MFQNIFSSSPLIWTGLIASLAALPILIHLINMLRHRRVKWAAMEFLLQSHKQSRNWVRIKQLLLLASRIAILLLILFMLGQVGCNNQNVASLLPGRTTHHYVLIDDSFSMSDAAGGVSAFDRARDALSFISGRTQSREYQRFTVLRFSRAESLLNSQDQPPQETNALSGGVKDDPPAATDEPIADLPVADMNAQWVDSLFDQTVDELGGKLVVSPLASGPLAALRITEQLVRGRDSERSIVYVLSDFRSKDWQSASSVQQIFKRLGAAEVEIQLVNCVKTSQPNLAITSLQPVGNIRVAGVPLMMNIDVKNFGSAPARKVQVQLTSAAYPAAAAGADPVALEPEIQPLPTILIDEIGVGQTESRRFPIFFHRPGQHAVRAFLNDDPIIADNARWSVTSFSTSAKVLLVDDEAQNSSSFVSLAISPNQLTGIEAKIGTKATLRDAKADELDQYESIMLLDIDRLDPSAVRNLSQYVNRGGGLIFFTGPNTNLRFYTDTLFKESAGLFPLPLEKVSGISDQLETTVPDIVPRQHPIFAPVLGIENSLLDLVQVQKVCTPPAEWSIDRDSKVEIAATVRGNDRQPLIVEQNYGRGHTMAVLTTAGPDWNNWARNGTFPAILLLMHEFVSSGRNLQSSKLAGETFDYKLPFASFQPKVVFVSPEGSLMAQERGGKDPSSFTRTAWEVTGDPLPDNKQEFLVQLGSVRGETNEPGVYERWLETNQSETAVMRIALNTNTSESDLTIVDRQQLLGDLSAAKPKFANWDQLAPDASVNRSTVLAKLLLVILLLLLVSEQILAFLTSYHPSSKVRTSVAASASVTRTNRKPAAA